MDELTELVSPEQLPDEASTRLLLDGSAVTVAPDGPHSWRFIELDAHLVRNDDAESEAYTVTGYEPGGSFAEALLVLREAAQVPEEGGHS